MGLDMYLKGKKFLWSHDGERDEMTKKLGDIPDGFKLSNIEIEVGYWRKANAIHQWFVENVHDGIDECQESDVSIEQLEALRSVIIKVISDHSTAEELLPVSSGFFFGSYEYDEYYFGDLKYTKELIDLIIESELESKGYYLYYQSSW